MKNIIDGFTFYLTMRIGAAFSWVLFFCVLAIKFFQWFSGVSIVNPLSNWYLLIGILAILFTLILIPLTYTD